MIAGILKPRYVKMKTNRAKSFADNDEWDNN